MEHSLNIKPEEIKNGRIRLGVLKVDLGKVFLFGTKEPLSQMISFVPGLGNGSYEVFADVKHVPGYGYRYTSLVVEFITDEEIKHYEEKDADLVLEVAY